MKTHKIEISTEDLLSVSAVCGNETRSTTISETVEASDFKIRMQLRFTKAHSKTSPGKKMVMALG